MGTSVALTFSEQKLVYILPRYFCSVIRRLATEEFYIAFCDDSRWLLVVRYLGLPVFDQTIRFLVHRPDRWTISRKTGQVIVQYFVQYFVLMSL